MEKLVFRNSYNAHLVKTPRDTEDCSDTRSLTVPDVTTRIGDLMIQYNGRLNELQAAQFNGLVFESAGRRFFHDELNPADVKRILELKEMESKIAAEKAENDLLFDKFKAHLAEIKSAVQKSAAQIPAADPQTSNLFGDTSS